MNKKLPRGIRNRNPGNLRYLKDWGWPGVTGKDANNFAIFSTPEDGLAEFIRQLRRDQKRGLKSLAQLLPKYAPVEENDTANYIRKVSERTGIPSQRPINLDDRAELMKVMKAFVIHENGNPPDGWDDDWYDDAVYLRAIDKAKPLSKSRTIKGVAGAAASAAVVVADAVVEVATTHTDAIVGAGEAAKSLWPTYGTLIAAFVGMCFLGYVAYARWTRTKPDEPQEDEA